jgi:hypothetical protein
MDTLSDDIFERALELAMWYESRFGTPYSEIPPDEALVRARLHSPEYLLRIANHLDDWRTFVEVLLQSAQLSYCAPDWDHVECYDGAHFKTVRAAFPSVCHIVHVNGTARTYKGTGVHIATKFSGIVLTAGHVIPRGYHPNDPSTGMLLVRFGFECSCVNGHIGQPKVPADFVVSQIHDDCPNRRDFATLSADPVAGTRRIEDICQPLALGNSDLIGNADPLLCIHHPRGAPKQASSGQRCGGSGSLLRHDCHADHGSSGAPILTPAGKVVAVHIDDSPGCEWNGLTSNEIRSNSPLF